MCGHQERSSHGCHFSLLFRSCRDLQRVGPESPWHCGPRPCIRCPSCSAMDRKPQGKCLSTWDAADSWPLACPSAFFESAVLAQSADGILLSCHQQSPLRKEQPARTFTTYAVRANI